MTDATKQDVMAWLMGRGLAADLLSAMGVKGVDHPSLGAVAAFPYRRGGEPYGAKFRTIDKLFASSKGVTRGLYNEDDLGRLRSQPIVIAEGEIDCLSVMQAGFERAVSVPDGWGENKAEDAALVAAEALLRESPFVIVAGDNDSAGAGMPRYVANLLKGHDVRYAVWPDGCKDANDVLMRHGEGALSACLHAAKRLDPPGGFITGFSDLPPMPERRVLRIGHWPFDKVVALEIGTLSVWTGVPGSGKSTFLVWAAEKISAAENIRVGLLAFETHAHTILDQLSLIITGHEFRDLNAEWQAKVGADLDRRFRIVHEQPDEEDIQQTMGWLEGMVRTLALRDGCKLIVIDPWNELEHLPEKGETMTTYVNWATKTLRQWAERLDVHIALVAHPKKMPTDGSPRPPTGYDIADSAAFFNKPSLGVTVHQRQKEDEDGNVDKWVELKVWKVRNTRLYGFEKGTVSVTFDRDRMAYVKRQAKVEAA